VHIALPTTADRDTWVTALQAAAATTFIDTVANRKLLPWLNTPNMRLRAVLYRQPGVWAQHHCVPDAALGIANLKLSPQTMLPARQWCVLSAVGRAIWLFKDESLAVRRVSKFSRHPHSLYSGQVRGSARSYNVGTGRVWSPWTSARLVRPRSPR
jgi:hypothetical protein